MMSLGVTACLEALLGQPGSEIVTFVLSKSKQ